MPKYRLRIVQSQATIYEGFMDVEAENEEAARQLGYEVESDELDWDESLGKSEIKLVEVFPR